MTWRGKEDSYLSLLGKGVLKKKDIEPELGALSWYVECFFELNTCRNTFNLSPIPFNVIIEFARLYNIEDTEEFFYIMRKVDNTYVEIMGKDNGEKRSKANTN